MKCALVYDAACGPCTRFKDGVKFLDARRRMDYLGLAEADMTGRLEPVDPVRRYRSFHLVSPEGRVWSGADALPQLAALLPGGFPLSRALAMCPPARSLAAFVYGVFSRLHDSGSCTLGSGGALKEAGTLGSSFPSLFGESHIY
ncbi:MAG: DUF393 domain-containing protein [Nitrososphaerota archaeon]|nr:DUF393 domain-containing protein [Nitrososphaerota archaeon]